MRAEVARHRTPRSVIAERLGVSTAAVSRRLLGQVPITAGELRDIAEVLNISPATLLDGTDDRTGQ